MLYTYVEYKIKVLTENRNVAYRPIQNGHLSCIQQPRSH